MDRLNLHSIKTEPVDDPTNCFEIEISPAPFIPATVPLKREIITPKIEPKFEENGTIELVEPKLEVTESKPEVISTRTTTLSNSSRKSVGKYNKRVNRSNSLPYQRSYKRSFVINEAYNLDTWKRKSLFKIGIYDKNYMTLDSLNLLKRMITLTISSAADGRGPRFYDCTAQNGWLQISCVNQWSYGWITRTVKTLNPWPNAQFRIIDCNNYENIWIIAFFVTYDEASSPHELITLLKKQNYGLSVDDWLLVNVLYDNQFMKTEFRVTEVHINELRRIHYRPWLGCSKAVVKARIQL